jgi:hypothetical protein
MRHQGGMQRRRMLPRFLPCASVEVAAPRVGPRLRREFAQAGFMAPPDHPGFPADTAAEIAAALAQVAPMDGNPLTLWAHLHAASQSGNRASFDALATLVRHGIVDPLAPGPACPELPPDEGAAEWKESDSLPASHGSDASDDEQDGPRLHGDSLLTDLVRYGRDDLPRMDWEVGPTISLQERLETLLHSDTGRRLRADQSQQFVAIALEREPKVGSQILSALAASGHDPLMVERAARATRIGDTHALRVLLAAGVDAQPLLRAAAASLQSESVRVLLEEGRAEVDATDRYGRTALYLIASQFSEVNNAATVATARVLLAHGADVHHYDAGGPSVVGQAARTAAITGQHELLWLLLANGANPHLSRRQGGSTALDIYRVLAGNPRWPDPPGASPA